MKINIITDNEWKGKYELIEKQFKKDRFNIISLGDNLPTGLKENVGRNSFFKTTLKNLIKTDDSIKKLSLAEQLDLTYDFNASEFMDFYKKAPGYIKQGSQFLKNSSLPKMVSITGNREFDYQELLNVVADKLNEKSLNYMDELSSCGKFDLYTLPGVKLYDSIGIVLLPYSPKPEEIGSKLEETLDSLNDLKSERIAIMTHENPCPEKIKLDRKAKMQETIDNYIIGVKKISTDIILFCGHLDKSAGAVEYNGIMVQPISGKEFVTFNTNKGSCDKQELK